MADLHVRGCYKFYAPTTELRPIVGVPPSTISANSFLVIRRTWILQAAEVTDKFPTKLYPSEEWVDICSTSGTPQGAVPAHVNHLQPGSPVSLSWMMQARWRRMPNSKRPYKTSRNFASSLRASSWARLKTRPAWLGIRHCAVQH